MLLNAPRKLFRDFLISEIDYGPTTATQPALLEVNLSSKDTVFIKISICRVLVLLKLGGDLFNTSRENITVPPPFLAI